jgi:hypothetical protein
MNRINPNNKKYDEIPTTIGSTEFDHEPTFKINSQRFVGEANRYDIIAKERDIRWTENTLFSIPSGITKYKVSEIVKGWRPKEGSGICSWRCDKDYSDNPKFEPRWTVYCEQENLFYELADFLETLP